MEPKLCDAPVQPKTCLFGSKCFPQFLLVGEKEIFRLSQGWSEIKNPAKN